MIINQRYRGKEKDNFALRKRTLRKGLGVKNYKTLYAKIMVAGNRSTWRRENVAPVNPGHIVETKSKSLGSRMDWTDLFLDLFMQ